MTPEKTEEGRVLQQTNTIVAAATGQYPNTDIEASATVDQHSSIMRDPSYCE